MGARVSRPNRRRTATKSTSLTTKRVAKLLRSGTPGRYLDRGDGRDSANQVEPVRGLYLVVNGKSAAHWELRYQLRGRTRFMGLGSARDFTLAEARARAKAARQKLADRIDPLEARRAAQAAAKAANAVKITFRDAAQKYHSQHSAKWRNAKHAAQFLSTMRVYVLPILGDIKVDCIDTAAVLRVLEQNVSAERGYPAGTLWKARTETANRVRNRIEGVLDWGAVRGYRTGDNPARWIGHLDQVLPGRGQIQKTNHHAALPYSELPAFIEALRQRQGSAARALEFAILTAARTGEVIGATEAEIDAAATTWTIPSGRIKGGREHKVPLSPRAREIIADRLTEEGNAYLFIGPRRGGLSNMALAAVLKRMGRDDVTVHGFRSTFRDWAAERTNFPNHVVEMALAHVIGNKVEAAYRRGNLFEQRRRLMAKWADYCNSPPRRASAEIVALHEARA